MFAALGGFWLYFFNGRNVKAQFVGQQPLATSASPELFAGAPYAGHRPSSRARPLSITIIGWFLLVGSALTPLCILFNKILFSGVQIPLFLFGFFVSGRGAYAILVMWMAIQLVAAVGLLKLKRWGWFATIALQCLGILNSTLMVAIPANRARFQQLMEIMSASVTARMPQPHPLPLAFPMWIGVATSLPIVVLILWFLVTRKQAFFSEAQDLSLP
jgi:hypothetical protein